MDTKSSVSRMRVMGVATVVNELTNRMLPHMEYDSPSSSFTMRLEQCDGDGATFGLVVRDGFSDETEPNCGTPACLTFECGRCVHFMRDLHAIADRFDETAEAIRNCGMRGEKLAHELEASAALLRLDVLWSEGEEVWAARGDMLAEWGNEELAEIARRFEELVEG